MFFPTGLLCFSSNSLYPESITAVSCTAHLTKKLKVYLNAYRLARFLMLQNFNISML